MVTTATERGGLLHATQAGHPYQQWGERPEMEKGYFNVVEVELPLHFNEPIMLAVNLPHMVLSSRRVARSCCRAAEHTELAVRGADCASKQFKCFPIPIR